MLELHVKAGCPACRQLRQRLEETGWAYRIVTHDAESDTAPPAHSLIDSQEVVVGHDAVARRLDETAVFVGEWQSFQSDLCSCRGIDDEPI